MVAGAVPVSLPLQEHTWETFSVHAAMGEPLTPERAGSALVDLALRDPASVAPGYLLTPAGLRDLPLPAPPRP